ncbi:hypothetical protein PsYK624_034840 [Phanerochaete sordida]|uniref:S-adenosyl-L-methionine-dependent methyltransferase n=1 Tax=Phanerochaete sordida TaxID=48140 RepID=A0A9P3L9L4_9APHY|nr:hypothetical protein PsYK624_034840 [Phanerochaete sordida]
MIWLAGSPALSDTPDPLAELEALSKIIQDSIESIKSSLSSKNMDFPSPYTPMSLESEAARMQPEVDQACAMITAAAYQLISDVRSPMLTIVTVATQYALSASLGIATAANVPEALREAGPKGAHVVEIAKASSIDPTKLSRVLRVLATNHIFLEVAPDVFAHNRISSCLDTGKSVETLLASATTISPGTKHVNTTGIAAGIGHCTDEALKSAAYLQDALLDPAFACSQEPTETARNLAFETNTAMFEWLEKEGNEHRLLRFGITMEGAKQASPPNAIMEGFDWQGLKKNSLVVDVGGGIGAQSMTLVQHFPHLRFVIQDRESTVEEAIQFWDRQLPGARSTGKVVLQIHDLFAPQPVCDAAVYLLRNIIHDWPDKYCLQILRHLRKAATSDTRLVIVDSLVSYACEDRSLEGILGARRVVPPKPLLSNMGHAAAASYFTDIQMMELLNGKERTLKEIKDLMEASGWKVVQIHQSLAFSTAKVIGTPA